MLENYQLLQSESFINLHSFFMKKLIYMSEEIISSDDFYNLNIDVIEYMLKIPNIIIRSETYLIKRLFDYYEYVFNTPENKEIYNNCFSNLFQYITLKLINYNELSNDYCSYSQQFCKLVEGTNRIYINLPVLPDLKFRRKILEYYSFKDCLISLSEYEKIQLNTMKIKDCLNILLESDNIKIKVITLIIISDLKIKYNCIYKILFSR